ncbi:MAG: glucosaminidase domain-containing protein [Methylocystaceae bacterium]|nr:glucosaminidase domain-containing protein [Methylocystaceae bacterium]
MAIKAKFAALGAFALLTALTACDAVGIKKVTHEEGLRLETPLLSRGNQLVDGQSAHPAKSYEEVHAFYERLGISTREALKGKAFKPTGLLSQVPKDFANIQTVDQKKEAFLAFTLLPIKAVNASLLEERADLLAIHRKYGDQGPYPAQIQDKLDHFANRFGGKANVADLLKRVDIIPPSLALSQAAIESGWGTSRFAIQGNALFGEHTTSKELGLDAEHARHVSVEAFDTVYDSVASYMMNLNSHAAYADLREIRANLRAKGQTISGQRLAVALTPYSERKQAYVTEVRSVISHNNLALLDVKQG